MSRRYGFILSAMALASAALAATTADAWQVAHDQAVAANLAAGIDHRWQREPSMSCVTSSTPVTLSSTAAARAAGFEYATVQSSLLARTIERNAELAYNANRYGRVSSRAAGVVTEVMKDLGENVAKGQTLAIIDSAELGTAKAETLQALETVNLWHANAKRERDLVEKGAGIEREALEAETRLAEARIALSKARQRLRNLGLSIDQISIVEKESDTSSLLAMTAPFDGMIVERTAVMGEVVESGKPLLSIADTRIMWAMVDLAETDLASVRTGQEARVAVDGLPGQSFNGRVTWISTQVDARTRTVKMRIELENREGLLRANMFGRAQISAGESRVAITIPKEAVQWEGCCNVAFVRASDDGTTFQPARLVLGFDAGDRYEVAQGLSPGAVIVTRNSYILKNEVLKNSVGAGCCEVDHLKK
jgi:cobalt-zinc-cadmium efflux system membrane fusion protein